MKQILKMLKIEDKSHKKSPNKEVKKEKKKNENENENENEEKNLFSINLENSENLFKVNVNNQESTKEKYTKNSTNNLNLNSNNNNDNNNNFENSKINIISQKSYNDLSIYLDLNLANDRKIAVLDLPTIDKNLKKLKLNSFYGSDHAGSKISIEEIYRSLIKSHLFKKISWVPINFINFKNSTISKSIIQKAIYLIYDSYLQLGKLKFENKKLECDEFKKIQEENYKLINELKNNKTIINDLSKQIFEQKEKIKIQEEAILELNQEINQKLTLVEKLEEKISKLVKKFDNTNTKYLRKINKIKEKFAFINEDTNGYIRKIVKLENKIKDLNFSILNFEDPRDVINKTIKNKKLSNQSTSDSQNDSRIDNIYFEKTIPNEIAFHLGIGLRRFSENEESEAKTILKFKYINPLIYLLSLNFKNSCSIISFLNPHDFIKISILSKEFRKTFFSTKFFVYFNKMVNLTINSLKQKITVLKFNSNSLLEAKRAEFEFEFNLNQAHIKQLIETYIIQGKKIVRNNDSFILLNKFRNTIINSIPEFLQENDSFFTKSNEYGNLIDSKENENEFDLNQNQNNEFSNLLRNNKELHMISTEKIHNFLIAELKSCKNDNSKINKFIKDLISDFSITIYNFYLLNNESLKVEILKDFLSKRYSFVKDKLETIQFKYNEKEVELKNISDYVIKVSNRIGELSRIIKSADLEIVDLKNINSILRFEIHRKEESIKNETANFENKIKILVKEVKKNRKEISNLKQTVEIFREKYEELNQIFNDSIQFL